MTLLPTLNRLRLRLGLFRAENYATFRLIAQTGRPLAPFWVVHWISYDGNDGCFRDRRQAIAHIRRCVKKGGEIRQ